MYPLYHDICDMVEFHEKIGISNEILLLTLSKREDLKQLVQGQKYGSFLVVDQTVRLEA